MPHWLNANSGVTLYITSELQRFSRSLLLIIARTETEIRW